VPGWETYIAGRKVHTAAREVAVIEQRQQHQAERKQLAAEQRAYRAEILDRNWRGRGEIFATPYKASSLPSKPPPKPS
jgi:hypothetical protein